MYTSVGDMKFKRNSNVFVVEGTMKGVLRGYANWNPVHPTLGAFWGMGLGVGCGIGWGPGFGPEVIGYVGSGCGVGFNVGFTLVGVGIGLPAHSLMGAPYNGHKFPQILTSGYFEFDGVNEVFDLSCCFGLHCSIFGD